MNLQVSFLSLSLSLSLSLFLSLSLSLSLAPLVDVMEKLQCLSAEVKTTSGSHLIGRFRFRVRVYIHAISRRVKFCK